MRDYFLHLLQHLDKLTGHQQYNKLLQHPEWKKEINLLLDILCRVCEQFPYIPEEAKKRILDTSVVTDGDFIGLNAKFVYKHLIANKDRYFRELAHQETKPEDEPLTGEAREKWLKEFAHAVANADAVMTQRASSRFDKIREEWKAPEGVKYQPNPEAGFIEDLKVQYGRSCTDRLTGKTLSGCPSFEEWVKQQSHNAKG